MYVEVISDGVEITDGLCRARINLATFISCAASEPYRRGVSRRWFTCPTRPALCEMNGRPC